MLTEIFGDEWGAAISRLLDKLPSSSTKWKQPMRRGARDPLQQMCTVAQFADIITGLGTLGIEETMGEFVQREVADAWKGVEETFAKQLDAAKVLSMSTLAQASMRVHTGNRTCTRIQIPGPAQARASSPSKELASNHARS